MFVQYVHVTPTKNGLAKVSSGNDDAGSSGVGSAVLAGDRLQSEMVIISAADKVQ
jgi:hypothetical protein